MGGCIIDLSQVLANVVETITKKSLTLRMETSSGGILEESFNNHAELFDFVTQRIMGDSAFDLAAEEMIEHVGDQWAQRGAHGEPWKRKGFKYGSDATRVGSKGE